MPSNHHPHDPYASQQTAAPVTSTAATGGYYPDEMGYYSDHSAGGGVRGGGSQYPLDQRQYYDDPAGGRGYPAGGGVGVGGNGQAYYDQQPMSGGRPPTSTNTGYGGVASSDADFAKMRQMYDEDY